MFNPYKVGVCCIRSRNMINLYNELEENILKNNNIHKLETKIKTNVIKELDSYSNLSNNDLLSLQLELQSLLNSNDVSNECIFRINTRLETSFDKKCKNTIKNGNLLKELDPNLEFSILDLINSKITIDTQKLVYNKISNLIADSDDTKNYIMMLKDIDKIYLISYLNLYEVSERLLINSSFDVERIPSFSFKELEENIFNDKGLNIDIIANYNNIFYLTSVNLIETIYQSKFNPSRVTSIYNNLYYVSKLDVLINYLNKEQLHNLLNLCNKLNINEMLKNDITNNINKKILEK